MGVQVLELYGCPLPDEADDAFRLALERAYCPFRRYHCEQVDRAACPPHSDKPHGVCLVRDATADPRPVPVCPSRMLDGGVVIEDACRLLHKGGEGCELYLLPGVSIPGGNMVDYLLVSVRDGLPVDFVGLDLQPLRPNGSVWVWRDRALDRVIEPSPEDGKRVPDPDESAPAVDIDWRGTVKEFLTGLHLKLGFFERLGKRLVVAAPEALVAYMIEEFSFDLLPRGHHGRESLRLHAYAFEPSRSCEPGEVGPDPAAAPAPYPNPLGQDGSDHDAARPRPRLASRMLLDSLQVAMALGLQASVQDELSSVLDQLSGRLTPEYHWRSPVVEGDGD